MNHDAPAVKSGAGTVRAPHMHFIALACQARGYRGGVVAYTARLGRIFANDVPAELNGLLPGPANEIFGNLVMHERINETCRRRSRRRMY